MASDGAILDLESSSTFSPLIARLPHLRSLKLTIGAIIYAIEHEMHFIHGLDLRKLPKRLESLHLHSPDCLSAILRVSLKNLVPNLHTLTLSKQYHPSIDHEAFFSSLPSLTHLDLPPNILFRPEEVRSIPKTLTQLSIALSWQPGTEEEVRKVLSLPFLKCLHLRSYPDAKWIQVVPPSITRLQFTTTAGLTLNSPLKEPTTLRIPDCWTPSVSDFSSGLLPGLQELSLPGDILSSISIEHIAALPRTITKLVARALTYSSPIRLQPWKSFALRASVSWPTLNLLPTYPNALSDSSSTGMLPIPQTSSLRTSLASMSPFSSR